ncbi:MAG: DUF4405 domain-containing protein [Desulfitobacterium sp.]
MKNKNLVKLTLDIVMYIVFVLLMKISFGGLTFHEIAGLGIGFVFIVHILLNLQWVKKITLRLFDQSLPRKTRLGYIINALLLIAMTFIVVSGVLISKILFPNLNVGNLRWLHEIHILGSYLSLILIGVHLRLHWQWIKGQIKKVFQGRPTQIALSLTKLSVILLLVFGGYSLVAPQLEAKLPELIPAIGSEADWAESGEHSLAQREFAKGGFEDQKAFEEKLREKGIDPEEFAKGGKKGEHRDSSSLAVIGIFTLIIGIFAGITRLIERRLARKK